MNGTEALETIKSIELWHIEHDEDENIDGEWVYTDHEVYDGTVRENYPEAIEVLEKELKDYHEIKEIAKHYHWDDFVKDTHMVDTDEKYLRLFNAAIPGIQADYRKARAFEILRGKTALDFNAIRNADNYAEYMKHYEEVVQGMTESGESAYYAMTIAATEDEFNLLKEVLG